MIYFREKAMGIAFLFSQKQRVSNMVYFREKAKGMALLFSKKREF